MAHKDRIKKQSLDACSCYIVCSECVLCWFMGVYCPNCQTEEVPPQMLIPGHDTALGLARRQLHKQFMVGMVTGIVLFAGDQHFLV